MKRKSIALLLALVMCLGLTVPAFAKGWEWTEDGYMGSVGNITFTYTYNGPPQFTFSYTGSGAVGKQEVEYARDIMVETGLWGSGALGDNTKVLTFNVGSGITSFPAKSEIEEIFSGLHFASIVINRDGSSTPTTQTVGGFTDVKSGDYFADPVLWAVEKGITSGTSKTTFSPSTNCTVAQILTFLWRANGSPKPTGSNPFSNVKDSDYYYGAALWAYEKGMVSEGTFNGSASCTRSMAVTYMWKAAGSSAASSSKFTDVPAGADYANAVAWAVEKGVTSGTSATTFSPDSVCTRGQIVTFLYRGLAE